MRLLELGESSATYVTMVQVDAIGIIVEVLREVTVALGQSSRINDDDKRWMVVKRERQFLQLAVACLKTTVSTSLKILFLYGSL